MQNERSRLLGVLRRPETYYAAAVMAGASTTAVAVYRAHFMASTLPPVSFPAENPFSESKRVLGKILFWDEQLSTDGTMACGTCHITGSGGADPTVALHPGNDGLPGTPDDKLASFGVVLADSGEAYTPEPVFGFERQVTERAANSAILAMYAEELFWDGRASDEFVDPVSGEVVIATGGALESQVVGPPQSTVEMAHEARDWPQITSKLEASAPLALATDWPADIAAAIAADPTYPELFEEAFGDAEISAARIAMAIATYERTLVADQTPWDMFMMGDNDAMTLQQIQGWTIFQNSQCAACHTPPLFSNNDFHNVALRPGNDDIGREAVTGLAADRGKFKTPSLRNVGLKATLMHTGQFNDVQQVFPFYAGPGAPMNPNRDALLPVAVPPPSVPAVTDFLVNGLTDPRVAAEQPPFDRPTLFGERAGEHTVVVSDGTPGSAGVTPGIIFNVPPYLGNSGFKLGLTGAIAGADATLVISDTAPVGGVLAPIETVGPVSTSGAGSEGFATGWWPIALDGALDGAVRYFQWEIADEGAAGGVARSPVVRATLFCGEQECPSACAGDFADASGFGPADGTVDFGDFFALSFLAGPCGTGTSNPSCAGDLSDSSGFGSPDGVIDFGDFFALSFLAGPCP